MDVINVGLGAVLYDINTGTYYTPNTGQVTGGEDEKTEPEEPEKKEETEEPEEGSETEQGADDELQVSEESDENKR